jgi:hypothetical protein
VVFISIRFDLIYPAILHETQIKLHRSPFHGTKYGYVPSNMKRIHIFKLPGWTIEVRFSAAAGIFFSSLPHPDRLWICPASYPMDTRISLPGGKAADEWS